MVVCTDVSCAIALVNDDVILINTYGGVGSLKGTTYFTCGERRGMFARPNMVVVSDAVCTSNANRAVHAGLARQPAIRRFHAFMPFPPCCETWEAAQTQGDSSPVVVA